ncbi:catabolite gene activator protein [Kiloniella litopenaei]|uniref:Catabolite gene activator protein n=1 Tax=Kiloniella litopenaei TaxID=1549748 RepID=A0A0M2RCF2_9PROT|nr:Crp/Fnr family transcriptional regulator [Kiloniella litopenaei]KKJ78119.1 catabolite gene activator protein [Kiloniella litopenaei]
MSLFLQTIQKLSPISSGEWAKAKALFLDRSYQADEIIFSAGDRPEGVYFLTKGIGRYFYIDSEGRERNKSLVKAGGAFASISSVVNGEQSPFYTQAITPCDVMVINYGDLIRLSEENKNWATFVRRLYENLVLKKERREADFLMLSARQRYEGFLAEFGADSDLIPLRHVAMYLGITDVTLSRIRREMAMT